MTETSPDTSPDLHDAAEAPPTTPRGRLRDRRQRAVENLFTDRDVPRMPGVVVRFGPLPGGMVEKINRDAEKSKSPDRYIIGAAIGLAHTCLGVYDVTTDETLATATTKDGRHLVSIDTEHPDLDPPKFDDRLAALLGIQTKDAVTVVRGLYLTDGDVTNESNAVTTWSGYVGDQELEDYEGN